MNCRHSCIYLKISHLLTAGSVVWVLLFFGSPAASAQSFLEKLEQAVRNQLSDATASPDDAPADVSDPLPPPKPAPPSPQTESGVPAGNGVAQAAEQPAQTLPAGRVYLGLEAENPAGGGIGVRVTGLTEQSPAWKAGFQIGDRILAVNGFAIADLDGMAQQLAKTAPGQSARFLVSRAGRNTQLTAVLMDAELAADIRSRGNAREAGTAPIDTSRNDFATSDDPAFLGLTVNDLSTSFRQQFGIAVFRGAAVSGVAGGSPAHRAGIRAGDVIVEAGGMPIESANELLNWVRTTRPGQRVELRYYRGGYARNVDLVMAAAGESTPSPRAASRRSLTPAEAAVAQGLPSGETTPPAATVDPAVPADATIEAPVVVPAPIELRPSTADNQPAEATEIQPTQQQTALAELVQRLRRQNAQLSAELQETRARLEATEERLSRILQLLEQDQIDQ